MQSKLDLQSTWIRNVVFFWFVVVSTVVCEAFPPPSPSFTIEKTRVWGMSTQPSVPPPPTTTEETTANTTFPNWRLIPRGTEDHTSHLIERPEWSEKQFKESLELYEILTKCKDEYVSPGIKTALNTLDHAYRMYGPKSVICSFNGGKDAVVILHLLRAAHAKHYKDVGGTPVRPRVVYFDHEDEFPEVLSFLRQSVENFDLDMVAFEKGVKFQDGLKILVDHNILPGSSISFPMAFVLGTRSSDPNAGCQDHFAPSSHWMPPFMRVNPVLHWNYGHIWHFLRQFDLPYCSLYDLGYTSLGTTKDTLPCPALAVNTGDGEASVLPKFFPAYMLRDWDQERAGRIKKEKLNDTKNAKVSSNNSKTMSKTFSALSITSQLRRTDSTVQQLVDGSLQDSASGHAPATGYESDKAMDDSLHFSVDDDPVHQKTVGILIIGDEILKGMTLDENTNAAAKALRKECVKLSRVVVVSDNPEEIEKEIQRMQGEVDVIITSGGVGPTHDDVTIKSVATALGREMVFHEEMAELLKAKMHNETQELTAAQIKMATLPSNAKLRYLSKVEDDWPVLQCRNIFILPGVPEFFAKKIQNVAAYLSSQLERSAAYKVVLKVDENSIVDVLNQAVTKHPNVTFGSYPFVAHPEFKTVLTLEGTLVVEEYGRVGDVGSGSGSPVRSLTSPLTSRNSRLFDRTDFTILPKGKRDHYVRLALDDLINSLPEGSILRVENDDFTPFT